MLVFKIIFILLCAVSIIYLVFPFITVVLSLLKKEKQAPKTEKQLDFACIITAYQNLKIAMPLVESLLRQTHSKRLIYLVADDCDVSGIKFIDPSVILLHPEKKLGSKVKSIIHAMEHFKRQHDGVVIFDPDNLAKTDFLSILNNYLNAGFKAVQGQRTAKNLDTVYACADATGEIYKNYIERQAPFILGSSPTIAGSGMAVETQLFREYLNDEKITASLKGNLVIVAEDKILQNFIVGKGLQIAFAKDAILYDEKISTGAQVERQRSRWLYSYFENFGNTLSLIRAGLFSFNRNLFLFGIITSTPPLFLLLIGSLLLSVISAFVSKALFFSLVIAIFVLIGNFFLVLLLSNAPREIWQAIWGMPLFVFRQFIALWKMKRSKNDFMHTRHQNVVSLDEIEQRSAVAK